LDFLTLFAVVCSAILLASENVSFSRASQHVTVA